jgi:hypothetical protein
MSSLRKFLEFLEFLLSLASLMRRSGILTIHLPTYTVVGSMKVFAHKIQLYSIVNMPNTLSYEDKSSPDHRRSGVLAILNVGTYGPIFLAIIATWKLYYLPKYLLWFFVFLWINEWIIRFAKQVIKQPRPGQFTYETPNVVSSGIAQFTYETPNVVSSGIAQPILRDSQHADHRYYGMPSGHMQHALFITVFLWLVNPSWAVLCICVTITGIILLERYNTKRHTLEQLFVGGISGSAVAYISVMIMQKYYEYY